MATTLSGSGARRMESRGGEFQDCSESSSDYMNDEKEIIDSVLAGEHDLFAVLVERYQEDISQQMWRFSRDIMIRDELVQEVFVESFTGLESFRGESPFLHWLRVIAVRVGYRHWKNKEKQKKHVPLEDWDGAEYNWVSCPGEEDACDPEQTEYAGKLMFSLLERLKSEERVVLTLMYYEKSSVAEIAQKLDWSEAMVKMRAYRARKKLKKIIEAEDILEKLPWTV